MNIVALIFGGAAIALAVVLYWMSNEIGKLDWKVMMNTFEATQFLANNNCMYSLNKNNLIVPRGQLQTAYMSYFILLNNRQPTQVEIDVIQTEADYLQRVNRELIGFKMALGVPLARKSKLQRLTVLFFVLLVFCQVFALAIPIAARLGQ